MRKAGFFQHENMPKASRWSSDIHMTMVDDAEPQARAFADLTMATSYP